MEELAHVTAVTKAPATKTSDTPGRKKEPQNRLGGDTGAREVAFTPAAPLDVVAEPGIGFLQPGGLVVHTGWSRTSHGQPVLRQYRAPEDGYGSPGFQSWEISTPDGQRVACFPYLTRADAEAAAALIAAALPGGMWPAGSDAASLLPLAREASSMPALLPLAHKGKPDWGSGYGPDIAGFYLPSTRAAYERMIAAHGRIPKNCQCCARLTRGRDRLGWLPRTNHWPAWSVHGGRDSLARAHCSCGVCLRLYVRMGTFGTVTDDQGRTQPASVAVYPWARSRTVMGPDIERGERPLWWFRHFLTEGGCVVIDERPGSGLWPQGVRHDDALFCETGIGGCELPAPPAPSPKS